MVDENLDKPSDTKSEEKSDAVEDKSVEEKSGKPSDTKSEKKSDAVEDKSVEEKSGKPSDAKSEKKSDAKSEKKSGKSQRYSKDSNSNQWNQNRNKNRRRDDQGPELIERVVKIRRVSKVVKGGRNLSFNAMVVVGDGNGNVGADLGSASTVPDAIRKATTNAKKTMKHVSLNGETLFHEANERFSGAKVLLKPAAPGTGVIAGGGVRAVMEAVGVKDVLSKTFGSSNTINIVRCTLNALYDMRDPQIEFSRRRDLNNNSNKE